MMEIKPNWVEERVGRENLETKEGRKERMKGKMGEERENKLTKFKPTEAND